ncbi:histidinol-phosphatase [Ophiostoma piceae UAMH 11346]|uniref:Histidinol-phosphatase n=1 Tax=Ophiostoma piceae (strain UAMH 11346) TaxID=1262450 RepID=S3BPE1_OPHP1|nr:histidinol-phosphatase [Ophiostoma piceae UAMH 11346]
MAFTMHSHSGEFCGHAVDTLEDVVQRAIAIGFQTLGLSEHMPRVHAQDLYPEERGDGSHLEEKLAGLQTKYDNYLQEAIRLREKYAPQIAILVGFEGEWIYGKDDDGVRIRAMAAHPEIDYFIGSVHHVGANGTPIDYDKATFAQAVTTATEKLAADSAGSTADSTASEKYLHLDYYDQQLDMLQTLRPRIVGHFDLIRLLSAAPDISPESDPTLSCVWPKIERNLKFVASYGGWLECNTAALRKGLAEPYPGRAISEAWLRLGGRFTMSDDSHGTAHVATNYKRGIAFLRELGVKDVWTLERKYSGKQRTRGALVDKAVSLDDFEASLKM